MGLNTISSDYGSGSSMISSTSWGSQELDWQSFQSHLMNSDKPRPKAASYADLLNGRCTIDEVMREFRTNGFDSPYTPDDDIWGAAPEPPPAVAPLYLRQRSWPAPERSPAPAPRPLHAAPPPAPAPVAAPNTTQADVVELPPSPQEVLSPEQRRVLSSLSDAAVLTLLREMQRRNKPLPEECRFCKNNGERNSYYRSHVLKDAQGRVVCPVLRAFVCKRCGARGDTAHTIKYCPYSTSEERIKSAHVMRSVRLSSGRRRSAPPMSRVPDYLMVEPPPAVAPLYLRQRSWPAPERSPAPAPRPLHAAPPPAPAPVAAPNTTQADVVELPPSPQEVLSPEQRRVLSSLSDAAVLTLLREMQRRNKPLPEECRFCKNNGERNSYYRSHVLKDAQGRVVCPVLRAFVCKRCGARGDTAHTIKYCPYSTSEERIKSAHVMRSVRLSSGRRRSAPPKSRVPDYLMVGETSPTALQGRDIYTQLPLDPLWAALEQKLLL